MLQNVSSTVSINNMVVPCMFWNVDVGTAGSIGKASARTSRKTLREIGFDLQELEDAQEAVPFTILARVDNEQALLFSGVYDRHAGNFDDDTVEFSASDLASTLVETSKAITIVDYENQTASQIVRSIANFYGFTPLVTDTPGAKAGAIFRGNSTFLPNPRAPWATIQTLARGVGFDARVTPNKELVFGPPGDGSPLKLVFNGGPLDSRIPVRNLTYQSSPRRNRTFQVRVISFNHVTQQQIIGDAVVVGTEQSRTSSAQVVKDPLGNIQINATVQSNQIISPGVYTGSAGAGIRNQLKDQLSSAPYYLFRINGLTPEQAQQRAAGIARDITKRQLVFRGQLTGKPSLTPQDRIVIEEGTPGCLDHYSGKPLAIASVSHRYVVGQEGFVTDFAALFVPPNSTQDVEEALLNWLP